MPNILITPKIAIPKKTPPKNIFTTTKPISDLTPTSVTEITGEETAMPKWAECGVSVDISCGCYPTVFPNKNCIPQEKILTNYGTRTQTPQSHIINTATPDLLVDYKPYTNRECCAHNFYPLTQYVKIAAKDSCEKDLYSKAFNYLRSNLHIKTMQNLMVGINGSPSVAMSAVDVSATDENNHTVKVDVCVGLSALQENHDSQTNLIAPTSAVNKLLSAGLLGTDTEGLYVLSTGARVICDPSWAGQVGPPKEPWDGQTTIGFDNLQQADSGCVWMYMTGDIYTGQYIKPIEIENPTQCEKIAIAEIDTIAAFDTCDVAGVLVDINKVVGCG